MFDPDDQGSVIAAWNTRADLSAAQVAAALENQERNYLELHSAAYDVWRWFETARPDLIGPRADKLRAVVMGPRPYGDAQPDARAALDRMLAEERRKALEEAQAACAAIRTRIANGPMPEGARFDYEQTIRALIEKEAPTPPSR